jgi:hypothetical protein
VRDDGGRVEGRRAENAHSVVVREDQVANGFVGVLPQPGEPIAGGDGCRARLHADQKVLAFDRAHIRIALRGQRPYAVGHDVESLGLGIEIGR